MKLTINQDVFRISEPFTISRGSRIEAHVLTVEAILNDVKGFGESVPYARYGETLQSVKAQIETLPETFTRNELQDLLPAGAARNAVDCALWDVEAKKAGKRVWDLAGLALPIPVITAFTLSLDTPEKMRAQAQKNCFRPLLKIKLGTPDDMPRLEAIRQGAPSSDIIVDANEGWNAKIYADLAPHLLRLGVKLVEQPLPAENDEALLEMARPVPVCADESCHDRKSLSKLTSKYDVVNIKLDKTGGLSEAILLRDEAIRLGYGIMVGCMLGSSLSMAPATLIAQGAMITDLDGPLLLAEDRNIPLIYDEQGIHPPKASLWG